MEDLAIKLLHLELLLGDGVDVAGDPAAVHNDLQVAEPGSLPVNWKKDITVNDLQSMQACDCLDR